MEAPPRLLFVDDYPVLLNGLKRAMRPHAGWEVETSSSGEEALGLLERREFDVVVSDMEMPGIGGIELLRQVRERWPRAARVMMSGQVDRDAFARAAPVIHRFLPKPCAVPELRATLKQLVELRSALDDVELRALLGGAALPSAPTLYLELTRAAADPASSFDGLAAIVAREPAAAARLLSLAGSAFFGSGEPVVSVKGAIARLGVEMTRALCLAAEVLVPGRAVDGLPARLQPATLQRSALTAARLAQRLAPHEPEVAFIGALLKDVGVLAIASPLRARLRELEALGSTEPRAESERRVLGATLPELGACLLGLWGLKSSIIEAVLRQRQPPLPGALSAQGAVWLAAQLADERFGAPWGLDLEAIERLGFSDQLPAWREALDAVAV